MTDFDDDPRDFSPGHFVRGGPARFAFGESSGPSGGRGFGGGHGHWHGGPPPWRGGRRARRGDIRTALLVALLDGPAHGYELILRLESRTGGAWRPSAGSVYPTLQLLEDEGLIAGRDDNGKRVFDLTAEGRQAANDASERVGPGPWSSDDSAHAELRNGVKGLVLAIRQAAAVGTEDQLTAAIAVVTEARQRIYQILAGTGAADTRTEEGEPER